MKRRLIRILTTEIASYLAPSFLDILNRKLVPRCVCSEHQLSTFGLVSRADAPKVDALRPWSEPANSQFPQLPRQGSRTGPAPTERLPPRIETLRTHPNRGGARTHATRGKMNHPDRSGRRSTYHHHHHPPTQSIYRHGRKPRRNRAKPRGERGA
jgi:hypothetical protein